VHKDRAKDKQPTSEPLWAGAATSDAAPEPEAEVAPAEAEPAAPKPEPEAEVAPVEAEAAAPEAEPEPEPAANEAEAEPTAPDDEPSADAEPTEDEPVAPDEGTSPTADLRALLAVGRPQAWLATALPFLIAAVDVERTLTPIMLVGVLYFLLPFDLLVQGIDELSVPEAARRTRIAIAATNLPFLVILVLWGGALAGLALALAIAAAIAYSVPPIRLKGRPVLDAICGASLVVLPAVCGTFVAGGTVADLPWLALATLFAWAMASHGLRSIGRVDDDRVAGIVSTAVRLGRQGAAALVLAAYVAAAGIATTVGATGALVGGALALYILLPIMVLAPSRHDPTAQEAAARRAWRTFDGLNLIVGLWFGLLLLRHWHVIVASPWVTAIAGSAVAAGYVGFNAVATRLGTRRRGIPEAFGSSEDDVPSLTVVVPCGTDPDRLFDTVTALRDQTYADLTILVIADEVGDDAVGAAVAAVGHDGRVVTAPAAPPPWERDAWIRRIGADEADTDLVLFIGADTLLAPIATRILVEQLLVRRLDLLSGVTRFAMETPGERASVPGFPMLLFGFAPIWLSSLTGGRPAALAFAYEPLMLVRRDAFDEVEGAGSVVPVGRSGLGLAQAMSRAGRRVGVVHAAGLGVIHHDRSIGETVADWRERFVSSVGGSLAIAILVMLLEVLAFGVPLLLPVAAILSGAPVRTLIASFVPLILLLVSRLLICLIQRQSPRTVVWHPVTILVALVGQMAGIADVVTGRRVSVEEPLEVPA
jgi:4-hydroxybenzoate polyprenyltransferase